MKKQLMIKLTIIIFLVIGLIGCTSTITDEDLDDNIDLNDNDPSEDNDKIPDSEKTRILDYSVTTVISIFDESNIKVGERTQQGFINDINAERYLITGSVKSIYNEPLRNIVILCRFYDINGAFLSQKSSKIPYIPPRDTERFSILCYKSTTMYFEKISHLEFEIIST